MTKILYILRGLPGSGKSTVAETLAENTKGVIACADDYFMVDDVYCFDYNKLKEAHTLSKNVCELGMLNEIPVIVSNTSTTDRELEPYMELAKKYGYMVFSLIVENRHGGINNHNCPEHVINDMKDRFSIKL
jgi:predicted kinase